MRVFSFTVNRYGFRRWGLFHSRRRFGVNLGRLAFRLNFGDYS